MPSSGNSAAFSLSPQCNRLLREERQQVFAEEAFEDDGVEEGGEEAGEVRRTVGP